MKTLLKISAALAYMGAALSASAIPYGFANITHNGATDIASQFSVDVYPDGTGVAFKFSNVGSVQSVISGVYFDDGSLLGISSIAASQGVKFNAAAAGAVDDLPGGALINPHFATTAGFFARSQSGNSANGINNSASGSEWLVVRFDLLPGSTVADTYAALANGNLRIGLDVRTSPTLGSRDTFVSGAGSAVAVPDGGATVLLLGIALLGLGLSTRRRA